MPTLVSRAEATWSGNLVEGRGQVSSATSDAFTDLPITWSARTEDHAGLTSPEELLAAAHAACFSMAFSSNLTKAGTPPTRLDVSAEVTFEKLDGGWTVVASALTVKGSVPGISAADFASIAEAAKDGCPISRALSPDIALSVNATLE
jgi:osmotically inducible protein OsmC